MTLFEAGTRNAMLWRVPGQRDASKGLNNRFVESIDIFPTIIGLTGVPTIPKCQNLDDPPTTQCLQGESFAAEFLPRSNSQGTRRNESVSKADWSVMIDTPKRYAFSQWPYQPWGNATELREGYSVRSALGYRYTVYVPYNFSDCAGNWWGPRGDEELYDYNIDPWESVNRAHNASYASVLAELRDVIRRQYTLPPSVD